MRPIATSRPTAGLRRPGVRLTAVRRVLVAEHARHPEDVVGARVDRPSPTHAAEEEQRATDARRTATATRQVVARPAPALAAVRSALAGRPGRPRSAR